MKFFRKTNLIIAGCTLLVILCVIGSMYFYDEEITKAMCHRNYTWDAAGQVTGWKCHNTGTFTDYDYTAEVKILPPGSSYSLDGGGAKGYGEPNWFGYQKSSGSYSVTTEIPRDWSEAVSMQKVVDNLRAIGKTSGNN